MANEPEVTQEEAAQALLQLTTVDPGPEPPAVEEPAAPAEPTPEATGTGDTLTEVVAEPQVAEDDLESLKTRNTELEAEIKETETRNEARMKAIQQRGAQSQRIVRDRLLSKSTAADNALRILKAGRTDSGVPEAEVDKSIRELEGTMHPDSASYVAPATKATTQEDQILVLNDFLDEQAMTGEEAEEFGKWVKTDAPTAMSQSDQNVARESLGGFLRLAHTRWREGMRDAGKREQTDNAVGAVQSVQRTQRQAARAASGTPAAPRKPQPTGQKTEIDLMKLPKEERDAAISLLVKQSMDQYQ